MGIQEFAAFGIGAVVLLSALIYGTMKAGRKRRTAASDDAVRRNFDKA
jgi:hypothetical protein